MLYLKERYCWGASGKNRRNIFRICYKNKLWGQQIHQEKEIKITDEMN